MNELEECFEANRQWAARMREREPEFFERLRHQQRPNLLWIGCSDSRLPPDRIIGKQPGEVFVHRNVGNVVVHTDMNCLSVLQYGIEVLGVRHVILCGHYGCGGVLAALQTQPLGLIDNWLRHIKEIRKKHDTELSKISGEPLQLDRLCELNVIEQVQNVCDTTIVQKAWQRGQMLAVHGWIYRIQDGLLHDLDVTITNTGEMETRFAQNK